MDIEQFYLFVKSATEGYVEIPSLAEVEEVLASLEGWSYAQDAACALLIRLLCLAKTVSQYELEQALKSAGFYGERKDRLVRMAIINEGFLEA